MTAPVTSNIEKAPRTHDKSHVHLRPRKTRIVRRRGRTNNGIESDDEIEREVRTDSETDDDQSSFASNSDSEDVSDDEPLTRRSEVLTPSTTQSPPPLDINGAASTSKGASHKTPLVNGASGPFVGATDWAQMVADENANGNGDLPVIDFAEMHEHAVEPHVPPPPPAPRTRKPQKQKKTAAAHVIKEPKPATAPPAPVTQPEPEPPAPAEEPIASTSTHSPTEQPASRLRGQSARQAYQNRLESDPSYVPKVGEFWGHDDRLLDKDLRSLSGWWRGRWQSRGRGRGGYTMRGRGGRGGSAGRSFVNAPDQSEEFDPAPPQEEVPPIERPWGHDGFEEMKRREEKRKAQAQPQPQPQAQWTQQQSMHSPPQRGFTFRGRGGFFAPRGRGGFARGGAVLSPSGSRHGLPFAPPPGRTWFAMKPEKMWTKQHDAFLYFDPVLRPRTGQGQGFRVKLPGHGGQVIRATPRSSATAGPSLSQGPPPAVETATVAPIDGSEKSFTVRINPRAGKEKAKEEAPAASIPSSEVSPEATETAQELSIEEVFTVRPHAVPNHVPLVPTTAESLPPTVPSQSQAALPPLITQLSPVHEPARPGPLSALPDAHMQRQLEQLSLSPHTEAINAPSSHIQETVLRNPPKPDMHAPVPHVPESRPLPPALPPLQTTFSPVPQTSPPYGPPYTYGAAPAMPPGVAMSHHGYPYEVATGRAVYLQPTPPPAMFTPRPMMHAHMHHPSASMPYMHHPHMHHHSVSSPDFLSHSHPHPHSPPVNGFVDPSTGVPIFTPARQSSRIEIRAPTEQGKTPMKLAPRPSGLRTTLSQPEMAQEEEETAVAGDEEPAEEGEGEGEQPQMHTRDPAMLSYAAPYHQQQYYYPEHYGYPPYMDVSPQVVHYEMYPPADQRAPQPIIYY